ncbi:MAG: UTP--glucose-1-phosphate uridylyltransferase GalU [Actinomycetota bacterium]
MKVTKAVIPAAGLGTRFLPATKAQPKEMLPMVDTPTIQWVVEEAVAAGLTDILIITGRGKRSIEDHFDRSFELESVLEAKGDTERLEQVRRITELADIHYIRQKEARGLGHAVSLAERHVAGEPFVVLLGDVITQGPLLTPMIETFDHYQRSVIALQTVPDETVGSVGIADTEDVQEGLVLVKDLIEKPPLDQAPSRLGIIGRYLLTPEVFDTLRDQETGWGGEIQLTDALKVLAKNQAVYGHLFTGDLFDMGRKLDYLAAQLELAVRRDDLREGTLQVVREFAARHGLV